MARIAKWHGPTVNLYLEGTGGSKGKEMKAVRLDEGLPVLTPGLHLVIGRPGTGATRLVSESVFRWVVEDEVKVAFNSLDMVKDELTRQFLQMIPARGLSQLETQRVGSFFVVGGIETCQNLEEFAEQCLMHRPDLVVVDGVQLMNVGNSLDLRMSGTFGAATSYKLKALAWLGKEIGSPLVATARLSRFGEFLYGCDDNTPLDFAETVVKLSRNERGEVVREVVKGNA